jgi:hypothetical protein
MNVHSITTRTVASTQPLAHATTVAAPSAFHADIAAIRAEAANAAAFAATGSCPWTSGKPPKG